MSEQIAKVRKANLGWEDHGILTCWLDLDYGDSGQGFGGYGLDDPIHKGSEFKGRRGTAFGMEFVCRVMRACGVEDWSQVAGRTVLAVRESDSFNAKVVGIKPLPTERGEPFMVADLQRDFGYTEAAPA